MTGGLERLRLPQDPPLTEEAFKELLAAAQAGDENARRELAERNLRLVMQVAQRFRNRGASMEDLFQVGCVALLEAIDRFDAGFGVKFSTYAVPRIIGRIREHLRSDTTVKLTRSQHDLAVEAGRAREVLTQRLGRSPTASEIAEHIGADSADTAAALSVLEPVESLDAEAFHGEGRSRVDRIAGEEEAGERLVERRALFEALGALDDVERQILILRYVRRMRQTEVAELLQVSQAHVSRMERRIIERLKAMLVP